MNACLEKNPAGQKTASGIFLRLPHSRAEKNGLQTTDSRRVAGQAPTKTASGRSKASIYDPQVEFLEIGVNVNGVWAYKVYGPDMDGRFGSYQGTGGLEATIMNGTGTATGVLNDFFGNGVATISGGSVTWNPTKVAGYGPLPDSTATPLTDATQLAQALIWRGHRIDPTGFYYLGARYYEPTSGRFLSCDPLSFAGGTNLYTFCNGDCVNFFDPDGMCAKGAAQGAVAGGLNPFDPNSAGQAAAAKSPDNWSLLDWLGFASAGSSANEENMDVKPPTQQEQQQQFNRGQTDIALSKAAGGAMAWGIVGMDMGAVNLAAEGQTLFRGTSAGFPGNPALQQIAITPATTDPVVATIFATEAENYGVGVVHIASPEALTGVPLVRGNVLASLESEVGVAMTPSQFAGAADTTISAAQSRAILQEMGVTTPQQIANPGALTEVLQNTPRLTPTQTQTFIQTANGVGSGGVANGVGSGVAN